MSNSQQNNRLPQTVGEAVDQLMAVMSLDDLATIREMSANDLIGLHFSLGMAIRNWFGLWGDNRALLESCASVRGVPGEFVHPDGASRIIIEALWQRLQEQR